MSFLFIPVRLISVFFVNAYLPHDGMKKKRGVDGGGALFFHSVRFVGGWTDGWMGAMACGCVRIVHFPLFLGVGPPPFFLLSVPEEHDVTNNRCTRKKQTTERQETKRNTSSISLLSLPWTWLYRICSSLYPVTTSLWCFPLFRINKQTNQPTNQRKRQI